MKSSLRVANLKGDIFGRTIYPPSRLTIKAFILAKLWRGSTKRAPIPGPRRQKKLGLDMVIMQSFSVLIYQLIRSRLITGICIMKNGLANQASCPRIPPRNRPSESCVASYISKKSCEAGEGTWTKVHINYKEKSSENKGACDGIQTVKGVAYEPHKITQGSENNEQDLVKVNKPEVIYAPSTVVNHNGINMNGKFSSYKWKVPYFPSQIIQRCVLRIR